MFRDKTPKNYNMSHAMPIDVLGMRKDFNDGHIDVEKW